MTNRIEQAWMALRGYPVTEKIPVPVIGEPHTGKLYLTHVPDKNSASVTASNGAVYYTRSIAKYYATCEQAYTANPGASVTEVSAIRVGNTYFTGEFSQVDVTPKPKRAKGAPR